MIIYDQIATLRDSILQYQPYFQKGFADVEIVEYSGKRNGIYLIDNTGEFEFANQFDYNFFYIRRNGNTAITGGNSQDGYILQSKFRLFASATNVNQYQFVELLFSTLATFCTGFNITAIETEIEKTLITEMKNVESVQVLLTRFRTQKIVAIDFSSVEQFNSFDVRYCNCDPCLPCAEK